MQTLLTTIAIASLVGCGSPANAAPGPAVQDQEAATKSAAEVERPDGKVAIELSDGEEVVHKEDGYQIELNMVLGQTATLSFAIGAFDYATVSKKGAGQRALFPSAGKIIVRPNRTGIYTYSLCGTESICNVERATSFVTITVKGDAAARR